MITAANGKAVLAVDLRPGLCTCGCGSPAARRFNQGHDQRLKGFLRRAHEAGEPVEVLIGKTRTRFPVAEAVAFLDTPDVSWSKWLGVDR